MQQSIALVDASAVLEVGRAIMKRETNRSVATEERRFREFFGCSPTVAANAWNMIELKGEEWTGIQQHFGREVKHMLWALMFLKTYAKESTLSTLAGGVDEKTLRKWSQIYVEALAMLEPYLVSFKNNIFYRTT
jgi:hypothetical protein